MAENPNEYNDEAYLKTTFELQEVVGKMWDAGASADDIRSEVDNALENVE